MFGLDHHWRISFVVLGVFYYSVDVEAHGDVHPDYGWDHHISGLFEVTHASDTFQVRLDAQYDCNGGHNDHEGGDQEVNHYFPGGKSQSEPA